MFDSFAGARVASLLAFLLAACAQPVPGPDPDADLAATDVVSLDEAEREVSEWGVFHTYYYSDTYATNHALAGMAVIGPGKQIHPPHVHADEEFLLVTAGSGTWHVNGETFPAATGDMLYAAPWDVHGITNTGTDSLTFVIWKWGGRGVPTPVAPDTGT